MKSRNEIKIGDLVEQYKHYEFDETKTAILKPGPSSDVAGTKWRFLGFGTSKYENDYEHKSLEQIKSTVESLKRYVDIDVNFAVEVLQFVNDLDEEPIVELELVEGIFSHLTPFQESELPQHDSEGPELFIDEKNDELPRRLHKVVELPGYIRRISNALGYRRSFPHASSHQQFFDEWRKVS